MLCLNCAKKFLNQKQRTFFVTLKIFYSTEFKKKLNIEPIIGLEIHAQLKSETKLFSGASASVKRDFPTNSQASLFDLAIPGTLPRLNQKSVEVIFFNINIKILRKP